MITLDGSQGEGGGQILRTALSLSMCTQQPFRIDNIRAGRKTPGLMRQHLTAVLAAAQVCEADTDGAAIGSMSLTFRPRAVKPGDYTFAIATAGSVTLVFQTLLPALMLAAAPSTVAFRGGTHNPMAPPFHFLARAFLPQLAKMGVEVRLDLARHGFYPAGGGAFSAAIVPAGGLGRLALTTRGAAREAYAESLLAGIPGHVGKRELDTVGRLMGWPAGQLRLRGLPADEGPGNALLITLDFEHVTEVITAFGEKGVSAEAVAERAVREARAYLASGAPVGEHLADQLMLPMALAGGGEFVASTMSLHARTNAEVIGRFLPVRIASMAGDGGWWVKITT